MIKDNEKLFRRVNITDWSKYDRTSIELSLNKINEVYRYQKAGSYHDGYWKVFKKLDDLVLEPEFSELKV